MGHSNTCRLVGGALVGGSVGWWSTCGGRWIGGGPVGGLVVGGRWFCNTSLVKLQAEG